MALTLWGGEVSDQDQARGKSPAQARMFTNETRNRSKARDRLSRAVRCLAQARELTWGLAAQDYTLPQHLTRAELVVLAEDLRGAVAYLSGLAETVSKAAIGE